MSTDSARTAPADSLGPLHTSLRSAVARQGPYTFETKITKPLQIQLSIMKKASMSRFSRSTDAIQICINVSTKFSDMARLMDEEYEKEEKPEKNRIEISSLHTSILQGVPQATGCNSSSAILNQGKRHLSANSCVVDDQRRNESYFSFSCTRLKRAPKNLPIHPERGRINRHVGCIPRPVIWGAPKQF